MGRRRLLVLAGAVVVAAGGATTWLVLRTDEPVAEPLVVPVSVGAQRETVSAAGTVEPAQRADLSFAVAGEVTEVLVAPGTQVSAGQALAAIDDTLLVAQLAAAESELAAAQERAADSDADGDSDAASDAAVLSAESAVAAAQEAVDQATLTATMAGTVAAVELAVGDRVTTGQPGGEDTAAHVTIVSARTFVVQAKVAAADVERLKAGLAVDVLPTGAGKPVAGTVATIGLVAEADESGAATFPVTIAVTGERDDLYAGTAATATIVVAEREDVLTVPSMALHTEGSDTFVYKVVGDKRVRTDVEVGASFGPSTEVLSGLAEGDEVEVQVNNPGGNDRAPGGSDDTLFGPGGGMQDGEIIVKSGPQGGGGR